MRPSDASRPARLSALAQPLVRSTSTAFSRSPAVSSRAFLQSIMPAPVRARSAATSLAGISFTIVTPPPPHENAALARSEEHTSELQSHSDIVCRLLL